MVLETKVTIIKQDVRVPYIMHEFSIAQSMLNLVEDQVGEKRVLFSATVTIGPLAGISIESLRFCFTEIAKQMGFGSPRLIINDVPARALCLDCSRQYAMKDMFEICPKCHSLHRSILSGEEFTLDSVELEEPEGEPKPTEK